MEKKLLKKIMGCLSGMFSDKPEESTKPEETMRSMPKEETDSLTGLKNGESFEKLVRKLLEMPRQYQVMLILDVDNLKLVNDTLGYSAGDEVLGRIAGELTGYFGKDHVIARMGGGEFAVFFVNGVPWEELADILETLQCIIRENLEDFGCALTVSIGAAWFQNRNPGYEGLYRCADNALYNSKREGKNRYTISTCCCGERENES